MKYLVRSQEFDDICSFTIQDTKTGETYHNVDIWTDAGLPHEPQDVESDGSFINFMRSFVGKTLEIPNLRPRAYFTNGKIEIL
jgi:hypothetical protein